MRMFVIPNQASRFELSRVILHNVLTSGHAVISPSCMEKLHSSRKT